MGLSLIYPHQHLEPVDSITHRILFKKKKSVLCFKIIKLSVGIRTTDSFELREYCFKCAHLEKISSTLTTAIQIKITRKITKKDNQWALKGFNCKIKTKTKVAIRVKEQNINTIFPKNRNDTIPWPIFSPFS